ncbi:hypothetical protein P7K49_024644, partial [Saguinus oedipus]
SPRTSCPLRVTRHTLKAPVLQQRQVAKKQPVTQIAADTLQEGVLRWSQPPNVPVRSSSLVAGIEAEAGPEPSCMVPSHGRDLERKR